MTKTIIRLCVLALALTALGCQERTEQTDTGGVLLELEVVNAVFRVGVNDTDVVTLPTVSIDSVLVQANGTTSRLMDVQLNTLEVVYSRADGGSRVPPPFVFNVVGTVPVGGTLTYSNLPILTESQLDREPLSDLLFENGGVDRETNASVIRLNVTIRVFGRTVGSQTEVASQPRTLTIEFVPSTTINF